MLFKYFKYSMNKMLVHMYSGPCFIGKYMITNKYLHDVFIKPEERNKGYGKYLIDNAIKDKHYLYLEVEEDNIPARKTYNRVGFTIGGYSDKRQFGKKLYLYHFHKK